MTDPGPRPRRHMGLMALLGFLSMTALGGGAALFIRPDGGLLGMGTGQLATNVFPDFRWPGVILFSVFGIGSAMALILLVRRSAIAGRSAMAVGAAQVVWIIVQVVMIKDPSVLQAVFLAVGIVITALAARANGSRNGTDGRTA